VSATRMRSAAEAASLVSETVMPSVRGRIPHAGNGRRHLCPTSGWGEFQSEQPDRHGQVYHKKAWQQLSGSVPVDQTIDAHVLMARGAGPGIRWCRLPLEAGIGCQLSVVAEKSGKKTAYAAPRCSIQILSCSRVGSKRETSGVISPARSKIGRSVQ